MTSSPPVASPPLSLPDAVAASFDAIVALSPGATSGAQLHTSEEWTALLSSLTTAGLLPQAELLQASRDLALPASLSQLARRLTAAHAPPRAEKIDTLLDGTVARVRHLHALLAEWDLGNLSTDHTARLLAMLEGLRGRIDASVGKLGEWHKGIHATLGPESCQSLFWDLIDPVAAECISAHAFQRDNLSAIEKRCAQLRVRHPVFQPDSRLATTGSFSYGIDIIIGSAPEVRDLKLRAVRCPHTGTTWADASSLIAAMDAIRQLSLSRHAPAFLGVEPCMPADPRTGFPAHSRWCLEFLGAGTLAEGLLHGGVLAETSLLFRHWRREIVEAMCHVSTQTTFLVCAKPRAAHLCTLKTPSVHSCEHWHPLRGTHCG